MDEVTQGTHGYSVGHTTYLTHPDGDRLSAAEDTPQGDDQGQMATDPYHASQLQEQGSYKCLNPTCDFHFSPERMASHDAMDTLDCPNCRKSYNMLDPAPFAQGIHYQGNDAYTPGGGTIAGISLKEQGDIGENIVRTLGEIPGYGSITWWHEGGASAASPLDGGTADWGIEVKTLNADAKNQRWIPGGARRSKVPGSLNVHDEKDSKNRSAEEMGYKGVLGVLVILDYRRSVADIYVREMPLEGEIRDTLGRPQPAQKPGVFAWRKHNGTHLVKEVPFANPFLQPDSPAPQVSDIPF